jgi:hypothetical protein
MPHSMSFSRNILLTLIKVNNETCAAMKYILHLLLFTALCFPAFAQEENDTPAKDPKIQKRIEAARAAYITERLGLTPEEAEKFWPVYKEFSDKRKVLRQQYVEAKKSGQNEETLLDLQLKTRQQELDLEKDYSGRLMKVISAQKLVNLRGAEHDFNRLIVRQIQQRQLHQERRQEFQERNQQRLQQRNN